MSIVFNKISLSQELIGWALFAKEQSQQCKQPLSEYFLRCLSYFDTSSKDNSLAIRRAIIVVEGKKSKRSFSAHKKKIHHHPLLNAGKEMLKRCTETNAHLINNPEYPEIHIDTSQVYFVLHPFWDGSTEHASLPQDNQDFWQRHLLQRSQYRKKRRTILESQGTSVEQVWFSKP